MKVIAITPNKKFDYLAASVIEGLYKMNVEIIASDRGNNVKKVYSEKKIIQHSKDADYILAFFGKFRGNKPPKHYLLDKINRPDITAYIDGSEWSYTGHPEENQEIESNNDPRRRKGKEWINPKMYDYCRWYFKRECYPEDADLGIIPLLLSATDKNFGNYENKRKIDVFCSFGQNQTGLRREIEIICRELGNEGYNVIVDFGFSYNKYMKLLSSSYIAIDAWGGGDCCARIWEIFANKVCCFSQKYNILFANKFTDEYNYVEYSTIQEFEEKIRYYLENKEKCLEIAERGYQHLLKFHTSKERVKYMLKIMQEG